MAFLLPGPAEGPDATGRKKKGEESFPALFIIRSGRPDRAFPGRFFRPHRRRTPAHGVDNLAFPMLRCYQSSLVHAEPAMPKELTSTYEAEILQECQEAIGYRFRQPELLRAALTHASGANTRLASNERLEFLGDAVLGLVCCEQLYLRFPEYQEGDLTKIKSVVVSRRTCARISRMLNLGDYLFLGKGMHAQTATVPANMLADVYESLVGAIYLDGGLEAAKGFILKHLAA